MESRVMCLMALTAALCLLTTIGGICTAVGSLLLNSADAAEYREAQCLVVSGRTPEGSRRRRTTLNYCDLTLNTSITGEQTFTETSSCPNGLPCNSCTSYGSESGRCWVVYREGDATSVDTLPAEVVGTFLGLAMTAMGATCFALCFLGCSCMRVTCIAVGEKRPMRVDPEVFGKESGGGPSNRDAKVGGLRESVARFTAASGVLISGLASMAIIWGIYLGILLLYFHSRELEIAGQILRKDAAWAGFGASALLLLLLPVMWCLLCMAKRHANTLLHEIAAISNSQQEVQQKMSRMLIEKLRSEKGAKYRQWLLQAGVGETAIERILTSPPEQMLETALEQLGAICFAKVATMMFEEMVNPPFENMMFSFAVTFLGLPGLLVYMSLWLACYCVSFEVGIVSSIISGLGLLTCIFLLLQSTTPYILTSSALNLALAVALIISWAQDGATGLSVLCFLFSFPCFAAWLACCLVFVFCLKPLAEALFEFAKELHIIGIWSIFGCERDPEELRSKREAVRRSAGRRLLELLGAERLLAELETAVG